ncbi:uncharacterized protein [Rhodnius prolixus]|uniref:Putative salivary secreted protein triatoma dimidiata n=1 Tax=Rhodnius prolixus TaxID=13249 RepID=A0A4P6D7F8_RHOPR
MEVKLVLLLILAMAATVLAMDTSCKSDSSHDLVLGDRQPKDKLIYSHTYRVPSKFLGSRSEVFMWPDKGVIFELINRVEVLNLLDIEDGGCVFLLNGGLEFSYVKLLLKTQFNSGAYFRISIYGV